LTPRNVCPQFAAASSTACSRLLIALWLVEVTPTRLPSRSSAADDVAAGVRLAGPRRTLHHERAAIESPRKIRDIGRIDRLGAGSNRGLHRAAFVQSGDARPGAPQDIPGRRIARPDGPVEHGIGEPAQRLFLLVLLDRVTRNQRAWMRRARRALDPGDERVVVDPDQLTEQRTAGVRIVAASSSAGSARRKS